MLHPSPSPRPHFPFLWVFQMLKHWGKKTQLLVVTLGPCEQTWWGVGLGLGGGIIFIYSVETISPFLWSSLIYFVCLHVTTERFVFLSPTSNAANYCLRPSWSKCARARVWVCVCVCVCVCVRVCVCVCKRDRLVLCKPMCLLLS